MTTNLRISGAQTGSRRESDIRINFNNPSQIIAAANARPEGNQAQFYSADGGASWGQSTLPFTGSDGLHSDPAVDWTSDGTAWAITIGIQGANTRLRAYLSNDGGQTWNFDDTVSGTQTDVDKELMWVDHSPSSPFRDNIYVIWYTGPAFVNRRTGPAGSWQTPLQISGAETTGTPIGGDITTNSAGDVFALWPDTGSSNLFFVKSIDGGVSFSAPALIATTFDSYDIGIPSFPSRRAFMYISAAAYRTATKDLVYAIWTDLTGEASCTSPANEPGADATSTCKTRIWFTRSTNGGTNWDAPRMINNQASLNDQFNSRLALDETTGELAVIYYDTVNDAARLKADVWLQISTDDGATWSTPDKVTTAQTDETSAGAGTAKYGDYNGMSGFGGRYFPSWTDRRNGTVEEIWTSPLRSPSCSLIIDKSTFGQDEVEVGLPGTSSFTPAYWVAVDGFSQTQLGLLGPADLNAPTLLPTVTATVDGVLNPSLSAPQVTAINNMLTVNTLAPPVVPLDPTFAQDPQRFLYPFTISFNGDAGFTALPPQTFALVTLLASITAGGVTRAASAVIELTTGEDPFFQNVNLANPNQPFWLSFDVRFFKVTTGQSRFGANPLNVADAPGFIANVITNLNTPGTNLNGDTFEGLSQDEGGSALEFLQDGATFNFTLARVRLLANGAVTVPNVRVFFRLFQAQSTVSDFNPNTTYRFGADNVPAGHKIPRLGVQNGEYVTIPCFAAARINRTAPANMDQQQDPPNVRDITITTPGVELDTYFGCWLDINQSDQFLPLTPPAGNFDGPWTTEFNNGQLKTLNEVITRAPHQCLIAEIRFDDTPIPPGATSATSDKLAQRNIAWLHGPNPGVDASRLVPHPFEIRPSEPFAETPDELMIMWGNTPLGSSASLYLPALSATEIVRLADLAYENHQLTALDPHTIGCPVGGVTFIPIPQGTARNAGLITIELHPSIRKRQVFDISVRQLTEGSTMTRQQKKLASSFAAVGQVPEWFTWRRLLGAFQLTIKVSTKEQLLASEEKLLSWLRWIAEAIPYDNRWYPVFQRYLDQVGGRVTGFGGDPNEITPSPAGTGRTSSPTCRKLRWLFSLILAWLIVLLVVAPVVWSTPVAVVGVILVLAVACFWYWRCKPSLCDLLCALILGISVAYLVLGIAVLLGWRGRNLILVFAVLGVLNGLLLAVAWLRGCCRRCPDKGK